MHDNVIYLQRVEKLVNYYWGLYIMTKEIEVLRRELYDLVKNNASFQKIYTVSLELDLLIVSYYRHKTETAKKSA